VRLNAAIVVARIAAQSQDAGLSSLIITELSDQNEGVVLWALKAAQSVMPSALNVTATKVKLITAVTVAAQRVKTGPIIAAAYNALSYDKLPQPADLIVPMQSLLAWRISQYAAGIPPEPPADARATNFLTERNIWLGAPSSQLATVQLIAQLIAADVQDQASAKGDDLDELNLLLKKLGESIYVVGVASADPSLQTASTPLQSITQRPPPMSAAAAAGRAIGALAVKFPGLKIPAGITVTATAPAAPAAPPAPANP
jgi:hypothetical protein